MNSKTLTEQQVIQLLKLQIVKFEDLPPAVKSAVEESFSENSSNPTAADLRKAKMKLIKTLGAAVDLRKKT